MFSGRHNFYMLVFWCEVQKGKNNFDSYFALDLKQYWKVLISDERVEKEKRRPMSQSAVKPLEQPFSLLLVHFLPSPTLWSLPHPSGCNVLSHLCDSFCQHSHTRLWLPAILMRVVLKLLLKLQANEMLIVDIVAVFCNFAINREELTFSEDLSMWQAGKKAFSHVFSW